LFNPVLRAMKDIGGSASIAEIERQVVKDIGLTDEEVAAPHSERQSEISYRLAWARTYLKAYGMLDNTSRGVWVLTASGRQTSSVDRHAVVATMTSLRRPSRVKSSESGVASDPITNEPALDISVVEAEEVIKEAWRTQLLDALLKLKPDAFERLCQRLLRESGFVEVRVTGRVGDGGIDGVGIVRLGGLLGFPVLFQCKRYRDSVSPSEVRDFRGAMVGRADRGLFITTGTFTRKAREEATRDGAPPIDLVDGEQLLEKLKELNLGVSIKMVEEVSIRHEFFQEI